MHRGASDLWIAGYLHILPPALAWLWRLVSPRGHANPSITETAGMTSEGVGSYWPFASGRMVDHANLLLRQIRQTPKVRYSLTPNQHVGAWSVSFMPQWISREYLGRRGIAKFPPGKLIPARCALLGYALDSMQIEGTTLPVWFLRVNEQPEVGNEGYDQGALILRDFFLQELQKFDDPELDSLGRHIIECFKDRGSVEDYEHFLAVGPCSSPFEKQTAEYSPGLWPANLAGCGHSFTKANSVVG